LLTGAGRGLFNLNRKTTAMDIAEGEPSPRLKRPYRQGVRMVPCPYCGAEYLPVKGSISCSANCRREMMSLWRKQKKQWLLSENVDRP